jgi:hypothetical protein
MAVWRALTVGLVAAVALGCAGPGEDTASPAGAAPAGTPAAAPAGPPATLERVTPVLAVEAIEPVVPFWEGLGFVPVNASYADGRLIFIGFAKDGLEVHYQTLAQIESNLPGATDLLAGSTSLVYLTVDDLDAIVARLGDAEVAIPRRRTAWGSDEIYVKEPGGHLIAFAAFSGG